MTDAIPLLESRCKKLASKVEKLRVQLETAEKDLADNQTALRVLSQLGTNSATDEAKGSSHARVLDALPTDGAGAMTPREVYTRLQANGVAISADNVRTILSRLKKDEEAGVRVTDGRYWREVGACHDTADDFDDLSILPRRAAPAFENDDLDSEVPF